MSAIYLTLRLSCRKIQSRILEKHSERAECRQRAEIDKT